VPCTFKSSTPQYSTLHDLAAHDSIDNHALHAYLFARGRNAEEFAAMSATPKKAAKYMVPFRHHLLYHPMDVGKGGAKRGNHLFKAFAPLLLAAAETNGWRHQRTNNFYTDSRARVTSGLGKLFCAKTKLQTKRPKSNRRSS
jgi:hypothetical protein